MAQAKSRLPPKDPSVELIGAEPVERLRGRDRALRPARTAPRRKRPDLNFGLMAANYRALVRALDRSSLQANTKKSRAAKFTQADLVRVLRAAQKADIPVRSARLDPEGVLIVIFGKPEDVAPSHLNRCGAAPDAADVL
jgi:hypothetical protein